MSRVPLRFVPAMAAVACVALGAPRGASASTCADYPNQAAAQRAADTRDADHDGIYCESLPCPCLRPGQNSPGDSGGGPARRPRLGPSVSLDPVRRRVGCHVRGPLPDPRCTPGARFKYATKAKVCRPGYARVVRNVSQATKDAVYRAYGIARHFNGANGEVDHLVSLELRGSNTRANLFPERARPRPGSHEKDRLENELHDEVCTGRITLRRAQRLIAHDWVAAYHARLS